jgi:hypothetical protein
MKASFTPASLIPEEFWLNFVFISDDGTRSTLPGALPLTSILTIPDHPYQAMLKGPAITAFNKDITAFGGLQSIKPGDCLTIGQLGSLIIEIRRINLNQGV